jgi:hypothetical protein
MKELKATRNLRFSNWKIPMRFLLDQSAERKLDFAALVSAKD